MLILSIILLLKMNTSERDDSRRGRILNSKSVTHKLGTKFWWCQANSEQVFHWQTWTSIRDLSETLAGKEVLARSYLQITWLIGEGSFVLLRSSLHSVQSVCFEAKKGSISSTMMRYISGLPTESIVDVKSKINLPDQPIESVT